ncbi:MAG: AI-2E family transporter, partial [Planctomycetota bacterium]
MTGSEQRASEDRSPPQRTLFTSRRRRLLYIALVALAALLLAYRLQRVLNPLLLALLIAYVLDPAVQWFERRLRGMRALAIAIVFALIAACGAGVVLYSLGTSSRGLEALLARATGGWALVVPQRPPELAPPEAQPPVPLAGRVFGRGYLIEQGPGLLALDVNRNGQWDPAFEPLLHRDEDGALTLTEDAIARGWRAVPGYLDQIRDALLARYRSLDPELVRGLIERLKQNTRWLQDAASAIWGWVTSELFGGLLTIFSYVFLVPIYTFFLLLGFPRLRAALRRYVPGRHRRRVLEIGARIDRACASFFRGRLLLAIGKALFVWWGLWLVGVEFSLTIGFLVGLLAIVPLLGPAVGLLLAVIFSYGPVGWGMRILGAAVVLVTSEVLEGLANPFVLGRGVGLHPLTVLVALFAFGDLLGVFGVLLAIPLAATLKILVQELVLPELEALAAEGEDEGGG